jgi:hypothetical protein
VADDGWEDEAGVARARSQVEEAVNSPEGVMAQARTAARVAQEGLPDSPTEARLPLAGDAIAARTTQNRINLADNVPNVASQPEYGGYLDVVMHGDAHGTQSYVEGRHTDFSLDQTCKLVEQSAAWGGRPIRLMSCSTGAAEYAQQMANRLGAPVYAPDGTLRVNADGTKYVMDHPDGAPGGWRRFEAESQ